MRVTLGTPLKTGSTDPALSGLSQAERASRALAESHREPEEPLPLRLLADSIDYRATLRSVAAAIVPAMADWCFIDLLDGDGVPRRVEVAHADPAKADLAVRMRAVPLGIDWSTPSVQTMRDRSPRLIRQIDESVLAWATHDEKHLEILRAIGPNSMVVMPLQSRDRVIGALTLIRSATLPGLAECDLVKVRELAGPASLAIDNARRMADERAARIAAQQEVDVERHERSLAQEGVARLRRLQSIAASLSAPLPPKVAARVAFENGLSMLEPSRATLVGTRDDGSLEMLYAHGWPTDLLDRWRVFPPDAPALVVEAHRTQTPIFIDTVEALQNAYPNVQEIPKLLGDQARAVVPLICDGQSYGAVGLAFRKSRRLGDGEREFMIAVGHLLAQAMARAKLRG
ncbi:MAG TPA: GAF domain-containing protein [Anaeromyxobacteraceae bacterium]|jgi:GAF domain-containing protein|nr:GAF domain-containing protein [Anaeromyxobacteraceae bacterium]